MMTDPTLQKKFQAAECTVEVLKKRVRQLESTDECCDFLRGMLNDSRKDEAIQKELNHLVMEHATCCIAVVSSEGKTLLANKKVYGLLGYNQNEMMQIGSHEIFGNYCENHMVEQMLCRKDGSWVLVGMSVATGILNNATVFIVVFNDITEKKVRENEIKSLSRFSDENPSPVWRISQDNEIIYKNPVAKSIFNHPDTSKNIENHPLWKQSLTQVLDNKGNHEVEIQINKQWFKCMFSYTPYEYVNVYGANVTNRVKATMSLHKAFAYMERRIGQRTSELRELNQKLTHEIEDHHKTKGMFSKELHRTLFESSSDAIMLLNDTGFFDCNAATLQLFGCKSVDDFVAKHPSQFSPELQPCGTRSAELANERIAYAFEHGSNCFEWVHQKTDGSNFHADVYITAYKHENDMALQATVRDISDRKRLENEILESKVTLEKKVSQRATELSQSNKSLQKEIKAHQETEDKLRQLSYQDELTGLGNRHRMADRLGHAIALGKRTQSQFALFFLDLDHFKAINDSLGHQAGDELLKQVAYRLQSSVRTSDTVVRMGGDEFAMLLENIKSEDEVFRVADTIINEFKNPFHLEKELHHVHCSLGIAFFPEHAETVLDLFKCADIALYKAKEVRNNYSTYNSIVDSKASYLNQLNHDLHDALENQQLYLLYQPKVRLSDGKIIGAEALVRWNHPKHGMVSPMEFIPIAEANGLIIPISDWILKEACHTLTVWRNQGRSDLCMAVNLSPVQLAEDALLDKVKACMLEYHILPNQLELEITETLTMNDPERSMQTCQKFVEMGVSIAIDDFGTGYSSLSRLKEMPISTLKIDRSFIRDICHDHNDRVFVEMIINLSKLLNLKVVAEGIEEAEHIEFLNSLACDIGQGYYFSPPISSDALLKLMKQGPFQTSPKSRCDSCSVETCIAGLKKTSDSTIKCTAGELNIATEEELISCSVSQ
ncbi:MAG: EAL domain-containing protein [Mariprofundaceae bacterium]